MTINPQENQPQEAVKNNDREINFRKQQELYDRQLKEERQGRMQAEERAAQLEKLAQGRQTDDEETDSEPYVDHKRLSKRFDSFEKRMDAKIEQKAEEKARQIVGQQKQESWLRSNPDFYEIMKHAEKFAERDPELADAILEMPDGFERQKLVYKNIKALGIHKPETKQPSIQETIDSKRRGAFYQPSNQGSPPYASAGDYSAGGQKTAYDKMQELKKNLRLG